MHHSDSHSREHVFPLCVRPVFSGAREHRLHGGGPGPAKRSTLTLTFRHARLHKAADIHTAAPQTHSHATGFGAVHRLDGPRWAARGAALESLAGSDK